MGGCGLRVGGCERATGQGMKSGEGDGDGDGEGDGAGEREAGPRKRREDSRGLYASREGGRRKGGEATNRDPVRPETIQRTVFFWAT